MAQMASQEILDKAMADAFMHTLRASIESRLRSDIEPLIEAAVADAMKTFSAKAGTMVDMFKDERLIKIMLERKPVSCPPTQTPREG